MDKNAVPSCNFADDLDWNDVRYALAVARCGSLAAAARTLGVDQTTVSRRLRVLESGIGTLLFERLKGRMAPTPAGEILIERGQRIEQEIAALFHLGADQEAQVRGVVRLTAAGAIVSRYLAGHLSALRERYPNLAVEMIASSRDLDLSRREADIAIRLGRPASGDYVVRRLATLAYGVYGTETKPEAAWSACNWVAYEQSLAHVPEMRWLSERIADERIVFRCNSLDALVTAVADGLGLGLLPRMVGARHVALRCLSGERSILDRELWLVVPRELRHVPRIRAVSDWLVERFAADREFFA